MSDSLVLHYTCTTDGTTTKNTVNVTWDKAAYHTPGALATDDADVVFGLDVETNKVINVYDDKTDPENPVFLGTRNWFDGAYTFEYALELPGVEGGCVDYTNTAVIDETGQSDTVTVTICTRYWAFTPGFWKNHTADSASGHDAWQYTAYDPTDALPFYLGIYATRQIKGMTKTFGELTMLDALSLKGGTNTIGALEILLRAGTAAVLNASFHEVMHGIVVGYFPKTSAEIIAMVNAAIASHDRDTMITLAGLLDYWNNGYHIIDWSWPVP
jgi:hypothetical protein